MMQLARRVGPWTIAALAMGCGSQQGGTAALSASRGGCSIIFCGDNAPTAGDGFLFDHLHLEGKPNHAGVRIIHTSILSAIDEPEQGARVPVTLGVDRQWFYVTRGPGEDGVRYEGRELVDRKAVVTLENASGRKLQILFAELDENEEGVRFEAGDPSAPEAIPVYLLKARLLPAERGWTGEIAEDPPFDQHVCNENTKLEEDPSWTSRYANYALVFRGDRYDPASKRVIGEHPQDGWFFLGCAGSAAAKMHAFRHTYAGASRYKPAEVPGAYATTLEQRTALLKAITADYCGNGSAFTVRGQKLAFTANTPSMPPLPARPRSLEAIWDHNGAVCLSSPRREQLPGSAAVSPSGPTWTRQEIDRTCGRKIPTCDALEAKGTNQGASLANWQRFGYAVTVNP